MSERERVPMPGHIFAAGDVAVTVGSPDFRMGRRFTMDVAEEALARIGPAAVEHVAQKLGERIAHEHRGQIEHAIGAFLHDRAWLEPLLRDAIGAVARERAHGIFDTLLRYGP